MTNTALYTGQAIGNVSDSDLSPQKLTLDTATRDVIISAEVTMSTSVGSGKRVGALKYVIAPFDVSAANAVTQMSRLAKEIPLFLGTINQPVVIGRSDFEPNAGGFLYAWLEVTNEGASATLDAIVTEL